MAFGIEAIDIVLGQKVESLGQSILVDKIPVGVVVITLHSVIRRNKNIMAEVI